MLLPLDLGGSKLAFLRDQSVPPIAWVLVVFCVATLIVGSVRVWRAADAPRMTWNETTELHRGTPRADRQVIHRALYRRGPLPPELRATATRFLWAPRNRISIWFVLTLNGANLVPSRFVLDDAFWTVTTVVAGLGMVVVMAVVPLLDRRHVRRAHQLGLPLEPPTTPTTPKS